jgi:hypothetical protein
MAEEDAKYPNGLPTSLKGEKAEKRKKIFITKHRNLLACA